MTGWDKEFDDPIVTPDDVTILTLRDAIQWLIQNVPIGDRRHPKVLLAATVLTNTAEGRDFMVHARAAVLQAIQRDADRVFDPSRKEPSWRKRKPRRET